MKRSYKIMLIVLGIVSMFSIFLFVFSNMNKVSSIGIIGGADGPTSILLAEKSGNSKLLYVGTVILILTLIIISIVAMKKKNNNVHR